MQEELTFWVCGLRDLHKNGKAAPARVSAQPENARPEAQMASRKSESQSVRATTGFAAACDALPSTITITTSHLPCLY